MSGLTRPGFVTALRLMDYTDIVPPPIRHLCVVVVTAFVLALNACGRSAEPVVPCPAPADDCAALLDQQAAIEAIYAAAADEGDTAAAVREESGACAQTLVGRALQLGCVEPCAELCRLHPCPVLSVDGDVVVQDGVEDGACETRCAEVAADGAVAQTLAVAIDRAAAEPGFCTCRGCASRDDALCTQLFDCAL